MDGCGGVQGVGVDGEFNGILLTRGWLKIYGKTFLEHDDIELSHVRACGSGI